MTSAALSSPAFAIATLLLSITLGLTAIAMVWSFERRSRRLPEATRFEGLGERNIALGAEIARKAEELRLIEARIDNRDRLAAEAGALQERIDALRLELTSLDSARLQIDKAKQEAADAEQQLAEVTTRLDEARLQAEGAAADRDAALRAIERLRSEASQLAEEIKTTGQRLPDEIATLKKEKAEIENDVAQLRASREALRSTEDEARRLVARIESLQVKAENAAEAGKLQHARTQALIAEREDADRVIAELRTEIENLRSLRERLLEHREEVGQLAVRIDEMRDSLAKLEQEADATRSQNANLTDVRDHLSSAIADLRSELAALSTLKDSVRDLEARKAALEEQVTQLRDSVGSDGKTTKVDPKQIIRDLQEVPSCIRVLPSRPRPAEEEESALHQVMQSLAAQGLEFDQRAVYAFHTALKINEVAQLAVLAGVSGTGKSLLPRCYAAAMGIGFLQIAVEPRWDSPQDLLGFYNYIEQRYRATDLARTLVHMDPYNTSTLRGSEEEDQMMLVLLDEMNLARVEYYFSEFLSRLEIRPRRVDLGDASRRLAAGLSIDIPGRDGGPIRLFPSHNVLFVGTMNDDESTQALSDKVLDRGNVLQFAAPARFAKPFGGAAPPPATTYRSFSGWQRWIQPIEKLNGGERDRVVNVIGELSRVMESFGRPFGHRLNEAILSYVANYPRGKGASVGPPIADQIEMRILPKLRGLPLEDFQVPFGKLVELIRHDAEDGQLATRLDQLIVAQRQGVGQFSWRGLDRR